MTAGGTARPLPMVLYAPVGLDEPVQRRVERLARTGAARRVASMEELFDATALFLHRVARGLPDSRRNMLERLHPSDGNLAGRTVLIVDDDVRNIFAMTSLLERHGMRVVSAETGPEALTALEARCGRFLPTIALTASATAGSGARGGRRRYIVKPVDADGLLATLAELRGAESPVVSLPVDRG